MTKNDAGATGEGPTVVVAGAGITGLSTAHFLRRLRPDARVLVLEARDRVGGNILTLRRDGFVIDGGPDSFLRTKPQAVALARSLGLGDDLITTADTGRKVYVVCDGRLATMPAGMALAVPTRLSPMLSTPLLSFGAKLRILGEPFIPQQEADHDESLGAFITRRFGKEAAERLAAPLLGGIYAGDVDQLSLRATFPQLAEMEDKHGSLTRGAFAAQLARRGEQVSEASGLFGRIRQVPELWRWMRREEQKAPSPFHSLRGGMGQLIDALMASLPADCVRLNSPLQHLSPADSQLRVEARGQEPILADAVVLAVPAHAAAEAVGDGSLSDQLAAIPYLSTATVFLAFERGAVEHPLDGVGFIAPKTEGEVLAATWVSSKWEGRAPKGTVLMRGFLGGVRGGESLGERSDEELTEVVLRELRRLMGRLDTPLFSQVFRWTRSNPQPVVGHHERVARIRERAQAFGPLVFAGAAYDGVGIPDCVRQAEEAAAQAAEHLPARRVSV